MSKKSPKTLPFSIRLSSAERKELELKAGKRPLGAYAREQLLDRKDTELRRVRAKRSKAPNHEKTQLAQIIGLIGKSERERSLKQIGNAAKIGALLLTPEVFSKIDQACRDISEIKSMLMTELRIKED